MANAIDQLTDRVLVLGRLTIVRRAITAVAVTISAVLQTFLIQAFIRPADLLPSGLTGVAVLLDRVTSLGGVHIDISLGMLALNIPVALLCWSGISKRFVIFSMMQVVLSSLFLNIFHFAPFLGDKIMLIIFGGVVSGLGAAIALKSGASTGGTDFIALWVSNHTGKTIWGVIFGFNCFILAIFGFIFGWDNAAYSIVFQFISTKTIDSFYRRYDRVTLQITTRKADEVMTAYVDHFQHGISCAEVIGGYSREKMYLLHAVVSTYESQDIIKLVCDIDPGAVINVFHTLNFVGGWWGGHVDEPMPTAVPDPDQDIHRIEGDLGHLAILLQHRKLCAGQDDAVAAATGELPHHAVELIHIGLAPGLHIVVDERHHVGLTLFAGIDDLNARGLTFAPIDICAHGTVGAHDADLVHRLGRHAQVGVELALPHHRAGQSIAHRLARHVDNRHLRKRLDLVVEVV